MLTIEERRGVARASSAARRRLRGAGARARANIQAPRALRRVRKKSHPSRDKLRTASGFCRSERRDVTARRKYLYVTASENDRRLRLNVAIRRKSPWRRDSSRESLEPILAPVAHTCALVMRNSRQALRAQTLGARDTSRRRRSARTPARICDRRKRCHATEERSPAWPCEASDPAGPITAQRSPMYAL